MDDDDLVARAETVVAASPHAVWRALTDPATVSRWMGGATVRSTWAVDSEITWSGTWQGTPFEDHGRILEYDPERRLRVTHTSGSPGPDAGPPHVVTYDLDAVDGGTRLGVTQENNPDAAMVEQSRRTWEAMLSSLKAVVESEGG